MKHHYRHQYTKKYWHHCGDRNRHLLRRWLHRQIRHENELLSTASPTSVPFSSTDLLHLFHCRGGGDSDNDDDVTTATASLLPSSDDFPSLSVSSSSSLSSLAASSSSSLSSSSNGNTNNKSNSNKSNNNNNPYEYIPITSLNDYGRSDQLQYASMSSTKFGLPIVACICSTEQFLQQLGNPHHHHHHHHHHHDAIVVCSLQRRHRRDGVIPTTTTLGNGLVRQLVTRDDVDSTTDINSRNDIDDNDDDNDQSSNSMDASTDAGSTTSSSLTTMKGMSNNNSPRTLLHTAMVVSGIRSDADYLSDRLRSHSVKHWFRYDTSPSLNNNMAEMVRDVMLDFLGYDRGEEVRSAQVSGGIGSAAPSYNGGGGGGGEEGAEDQGNSRAGRPLGVSVFLLGGFDGEGAEVTLMEADGSSRTYVARAMGVGSQVANHQLSHRWRKNMTVDEAKDLMKSIMKDVAREVGWLHRSEGDDDEVECRDGNDEGELAVVCEIVTSNGIDVHMLTM